MLGEPTSKYYKVHATPRGANDARPTALRIINDEDLEGKWSDKTVLITGGNAFVGAETARALHTTGATVYITVRDTAKGQKAIDEIMKTDPASKAPIHMITMDLTDFDSVRAGAADFLKQSGNKLNLLICNAGVMAIPFALTKDGFETQFQTNYLAHFLLFQLLKPALLASSTKEYNSRVIMLASESHRSNEVRFDDYNWKEGYRPDKAYGQSKTATVYMANSIDRRFGSQGLHALSVHPGAIRTNLSAHLAKMIEPLWQIPAIKAREKTAAQGAATPVYAAVSAEWEGKGGRYLSNCMVMGPFQGKEGFEVMDEGYAPWAYDEEKQDRLWTDSLKMIGMEESS
jgi:NAD(P)-dependent dehydrogenase (short-subunit alcohol dehydrogenase family)